MNNVRRSRQSTHLWRMPSHTSRPRRCWSNRLPSTERSAPPQRRCAARSWSAEPSHKELTGPAARGSASGAPVVCVYVSMRLYSGTLWYPALGQVKPCPENTSATHQRQISERHGTDQRSFIMCHLISIAYVQRILPDRKTSPYVSGAECRRDSGCKEGLSPWPPGPLYGMKRTTTHSILDMIGGERTNLDWHWTCWGYHTADISSPPPAALAPLSLLRRG